MVGTHDIEAMLIKCAREVQAKINGGPMQLKTRMDFPLLLNEMGLKGHACEIGIANGYFSFPLLDRWPGTLYMVDPWGPPDPSRGQENVPLGEQERRYSSVCEQAKRYGGRAQVMRMKSSSAAALFDDDSRDFVYLDGDHSLAGITEDLELWWPKVKSGGVLAGHDYLDGIVGGVMYGVKPAVDRFAEERGLQQSGFLTGLHVIEEEWPGYWMVKP